MGKLHVFSVLAALIALLALGACEKPVGEDAEVPGGGGGTSGGSENRLVWFSDLTTPNYDGARIKFFGGYNGTVEAKDIASGGAGGSRAYWQLDGTGRETWAAGGWNNDTDPGTDFSRYTKLSFWARETPAANVPAGKNPGKSIKFGIETYNGVVAKQKISFEIERTITTSWAEYEINFNEFKNANAVTKANWDAKRFAVLKYVLPANNVSVDVDEIMFE